MRKHHGDRSLDLLQSLDHLVHVEVLPDAVLALVIHLCLFISSAAHFQHKYLIAVEIHGLESRILFNQINGSNRFHDKVEVIVPRDKCHYTHDEHFNHASQVRKHTHDRLHISIMNYNVVAEEKVGAPEVMNLVLLKRLASVSASISSLNVFLANPGRKHLSINEGVLSLGFEDSPSVVAGVHIVDPQEVVVVSVLVEVQLELGMKQANSYQWILAQSLLRQFCILNQGVKSEKMRAQKPSDLCIRLTVGVMPLWARVNFS